MKIHDNFSLQHYNTFQVDAQARYFLKAGKVADLQEAMAFCSAKKLPFLMLGQGSNVLFRNDYPGLVIELAIKGITLVEENADQVLVKVSCGEIWHDFVMQALNKGWYGLENLALIPGTVGAAPVQNIGAYGVELADVCEGVEALSVSDNNLLGFDHEDCRFSYRNSTFKQENRDKYIITAVFMRLSRSPVVNLDYGALKKAMADIPQEALSPLLVAENVCRIRRSKLPDPELLGNAGSFFCNPVITTEHFNQLQSVHEEIPGYADEGGIKVPAAWLIEKAGWKGHREQQVGVHDKHALVLVNHGGGSGEQLCALAEKIQQSVEEHFSVKLYPEVRIV